MPIPPRSSVSPAHPRSALSRAGAPVAWLVATVAFLAAPGLQAQDARFSGRPLHAGHWSYDFLEILHARGAPQVWPVWLEPLPAAPLYDAMNAAASDTKRPNSAVTTWTEAFRAEAALPATQWGRLGLAAGYETSQVALVPERGGYLEGVGEVPVSTAISFWAAGSVATEGSAEFLSGGMAATFGAGQLLIGRISPKIGQGTSRILLAGRNPMDGVMLATARPYEISALGRVTAHIFIAPNIDTPAVSGVWFSSFGLSIEPHPAVTLGAYRTVRFGGDGLSEGTSDDLLSLFPFQGGDNPAEDNQGELAARVRFSAWGQPMAVYGTLGFEDPASAWEDPALIAGLLLPIDLSAGVLSARYEYQGFGESARWCGSCPAESHRWYRQREYGPYQIEDVLLASSLGGYGSRHQVQLSYWGRSPVRVAGTFFVENREEQNLLYDRWPGSRTGFAVSLSTRPRPGWEVGLQGVVSDSDVGAQSGINLVFRVFDAIRNPAGTPR